MGDPILSMSDGSQVFDIRSKFLYNFSTFRNHINDILNFYDVKDTTFNASFVNTHANSLVIPDHYKCKENGLEKLKEIIMDGKKGQHLKDIVYIWKLDNLIDRIGLVQNRDKYFNLSRC